MFANQTVKEVADSVQQSRILQRLRNQKIRIEAEIRQEKLRQQTRMEIEGLRNQIKYLGHEPCA